MIYPSFGANFTNASVLLSAYNIISKFYCKSKVSRLGYYMFDGVNHRGIEVNSLPVDIEEVTQQEFIDRIKNLVNSVQEYIKGLSIGDKVIIDPLVGYPDDYPLGFVEEMATRWSNKEMTIVDIVHRDHPSSAKFYNGFSRTYKMLEDGGTYNWDSSMFKFVLPVPVEKIELSPIKLII